MGEYQAHGHSHSHGGGAHSAGDELQASGSAGASATGQADEVNDAQGADGAAPDDAQVGQGGTADDPSSKAAALRRHTRNRKRVKGIIDAGLAQEIDAGLGANSRKNLWRNTAQWIDQGQAQLFVLSPVHDSKPRAAIGAGKAGFFDSGKDYKTDGATYADDVTDNTGIKIEDGDTLGSLSTDGNTMTLYDPSQRSDALLVETLIHEVQHDADQHQKDKAFEYEPPSGATAPAWAYNGYQTEFRAYWYENPPGSKADTWPAASDPVTGELTVTVNKPGPDGTFGTGDDVAVGTVTTALKNARQEAILRHLVEPIRANGDWYANGAWTQSYAYVAYYMVKDPKFLQMVNDHAQPTGGNLLNSVRIQDLSDAIDSKDLQQVMEATDALDGADLAFLKDRTQSKPFWDHAEGTLSGLMEVPHLCYLVFAVNGSVPPAAEADGGSYTVVPGDNLSKIAARTLGDANRYREIVALNRDQIRDKNTIRPGWVLRLPKP